MRAGSLRRVGRRHAEALEGDQGGVHSDDAGLQDGATLLSAVELRVFEVDGEEDVQGGLLSERVNGPAGAEGEVRQVAGSDVLGLSAVVEGVEAHAAPGQVD